MIGQCLLLRGSDGLHRFFVKDIATDSPEVIIAGEEAAHLNRVLRLGPGDLIEVCDGRGRAFRAQITRSDSGESRARLLEPILKDSEPDLQLILAQALVKGERMDFVLQKGTELGVHTFVPTICRRSVVRLEKGREARRRKRWQRIVKEAAKQCGRTIVPQVKPAVELEEMLREYGGEGTHIIFPWEGEGSLGLDTVLGNIFPHGGKTLRVLVVVGPEGGFELDEVELADEYGARIVSLGSRVLRSETAALAAISIILYEAGDLGAACRG